MVIKTLDAAMIQKCFLAGANNIEAKKEYINEFNEIPNLEFVAYYTPELMISKFCPLKTHNECGKCHHNTYLLKDEYDLYRAAQKAHQARTYRDPRLLRGKGVRGRLRGQQVCGWIWHGEVKSSAFYNCAPRNITLTGIGLMPQAENGP